MRLFAMLEMWCRKQAAAVIFPLLLAGWLTGDSSEALTTFGKSNTQPPNQALPTPPPARPCQRQAECAGITGTSCVRTHSDSATRCLCGDNLPPLNGRCESHSKALYHACGVSEDCNEGLLCGTPNITGATPVHLRVHGPTDKICICDVVNGYQEKEHTCSDAAILKTSLLAVLVVTCIRKFFMDFY